MSTRPEECQYCGTDHWSHEHCPELDGDELDGDEADDTADEDTNLIDRIEAAIRTDDDSPERNSERIIEKYTAATEAERAIVDDIFTSLCGWSLKTLIAGGELADNDTEKKDDTDAGV